MPPTQPLLDRLAGIQAILMAHYSASVSLPSAFKGQEREILVREFLGSVFPTPFRFGTGAITDSDGATSGQLDVVVEFPFFPSFPTPGTPERLYLADSIAFVVEVKSDLSDQWNQVEACVEKVRPLHRNWNSHSNVNNDGEIEDNTASVSRIPVLAVAYRGAKSIAALSERLRSTPEAKRPDGLLVIESGAYFGMNANGVGPAGLFAFCVDATIMARNILWASLNFGRYETLLKPSAG